MASSHIPRAARLKAKARTCAHPGLQQLPVPGLNFQPPSSSSTSHHDTLSQIERCCDEY